MKYPTYHIGPFSPALYGANSPKVAPKGRALQGPALKGPKIADFWQSGVVFAALLFGTIHLSRHQRKGVLKYLCLIARVG